MKIKNITPFLLAILCFISLLFLSTLENYSLYLFGIGSDEISFILNLAGFFFLIIGICSIFFKRGASKAKAIIGIILILLTIATSIIPSYLTLPWTVAWHEYESPDQRHTIVVQEKAFLLAGGGTVYQQISPFLLKKVETYSTDDGFSPFKENKFKITWARDRVTVSYLYDPMLPEQYKELIVDFSGDKHEKN